MRKLAILAAFFATSVAFASPTTPAAPQYLSVNNKTLKNTVAIVNGQPSAVAGPGVNLIPWAAVSQVCDYISPCITRIYVLSQNRPGVLVGSLSFNLRTGVITPIPANNGYSIVIKGPGSVVLKKAHS